MPSIFTLHLRHAAIGFGLGALFVALLLGADIAGLRGLIAGTPDGLLSLAALVALTGVTFSAVQVAVATALSDERQDQADRIAIPVRTDDRR